MCSGSATPGNSTACSGNSGSCTCRDGAVMRTACREHRHWATNQSGDPPRSPRAGRPRCGSVVTGAWRAGRVGGAEAAAAAAGGNGVGIVDRETGTHQRVEIVDLGALEVLRALAVDVDVDAV